MRKSDRHETSTVIVGSGFSGLGMAIRLKQAGVHDFIVLEKDTELGGTWRDNSYPGCACDVPSLMYSFSFELNPDWSRIYAEQKEILDYLRHCADKYDIREHIHFGVEVTGAEFDETLHQWHVSTTDGTEYVAEALVSGIGQLHIPNYPNLKGIEHFKGEVFHSAEWNHDFDLTGKRVAVVGTGASAIQFVPRISEQAEHLVIFQRTPPWILPRPDHPVSAPVRRAFRRVPGLQRLARAVLYWTLELRFAAAFRNKFLRKVFERQILRFIRQTIPDPALRSAVIPDYALGCKRILFSNDYYPVLTLPQVELETAGIAEVREHSVITADGCEHEVDAIIYATGFHVIDGFERLAIVGRDGRKLQDAWRDGVQTYLGITVSGFPNLFFLLGPNTGLGHHSVVFMIECQINYVLKILRRTRRQNVAQVNVRQHAQDRINRRLQSQLTERVWSQGGCRSWYLDENGVNRSLWPGFAYQYWSRTHDVKWSDYELEHPRV